MNFFKNFFTATAMTAALAASAQADVPSLSNLTMGNVDNTFKTFGSLMNFRPLEPASSFGKYFGVSVGVVAQATPASKIKDFIPNSGQLPSYLPDAFITAVIQAPLGLSAELGVFPARKIKDFHLEQYAANVKWTVNEVFFDWLPVDVAVRVGYASGKLLYDQSISGVPIVIDFSQALWNANLSVSKRLWFFEPFFGAGIVQQNATLTANASGTATFRLLGSDFGVPIQQANSVNQTRTVPHVFLGAQLHFFALNLTLQDDIQFGINNFALKLALKF